MFLKHFLLNSSLFMKFSCPVIFRTVELSSSSILSTGTLTIYRIKQQEILYLHSKYQ